MIIGFSEFLKKTISIPQKKIIIDTDIGVDDAFAIMLALGNPDLLNLLAIITVEGNTSLENSTRNAHYLLKVTDNQHIPIYDGEPHAIYESWKPPSASDFHGAKGLGTIELDTEIDLKNDGVNHLLRLVKENPNEISLVCLGPLTNLAKAIAVEPDTMALLKDVVLLGGTFSLPGNITKSAEFNIYSDPEAANLVFNFPIKKTMIPIDTCNTSSITESYFSKITDDDKRTLFLSILGRYLEASRNSGVPGTLYDTFAIYYLLNPGAFETTDKNVSVETFGEHTRGMTVVDQRNPTDAQPNISIATKIDRDQYVPDFFASLNRISASGLEPPKKKENYAEFIRNLKTVFFVLVIAMASKYSSTHCSLFK